MAFRKTAFATVAKSGINFKGWEDVRAKAGGFQTRTAGKVALDKFDPNEFLLSHVTIMSSVDTENGPGKLGRQMVRGMEIDRRYQDYYITPGTSQHINNNCFVPGTLITMWDGTVQPIETIVPGDIVISHTGQRRKVLKTFSKDVSEKLREIKVRGTTERLMVTKDHPFFVFRPEACHGCGTEFPRYLRCITYLLGKNYCSRKCSKAKASNKEVISHKKGVFTPASQLTTSDFATFPVLSDTVDVPLTPGQARLIGLFLAEGYYELTEVTDKGALNRPGLKVGEYERTGACWALNLNETDTLAKLVQDLLHEEFGADSVIHRHTETDGIYVTTRTNRSVANFFTHWVRGYSSKTKTLHPDLLTAPKSIQMEVARGWLEGDGCLGDYADLRLSGASACRSLISQMQIILHRLGVSSRICKAETDGRKRTLAEDGSVLIVPDPSKTSTAWQLSMGGGWVSDLVEDTYYERAYHKSIEDRGGYQNVSELRYLNGYHVQIIEKINDISYEGPVFNFEVEVDDSYIANGSAVHNCDSWERKLLLNTYTSFIGSENYLEHLQIPEMSKGRIIDAAARDIGESVYIDILVATNRKHKPLIASILNGSLSTLSMGATVAHTTCSNCGNVAVDETQLCEHIKYAKGNDFFDAMGVRRKNAEICGHFTDPTSCQFIEASWVANPAFKGAVLRNILSPEEVASIGGEKTLIAFSKPVKVNNPFAIPKAASLKKADFGVGQQTPEESEATKEDTKGDAKDPIRGIVEDLTNAIHEQVIKKIREEIGKGEADSANAIDLNGNDNLIHAALEHPEWRGVAKKVASAIPDRPLMKKVLAGLILHKNDGYAGLIKSGNYSGKELLIIARMVDMLSKRSIVAGDTRLYRTVLKVGGMRPYSNIESYLSACRQVVGRDLNSDEVSILIDRGRLFALGS